MFRRINRRHHIVMMSVMIIVAFLLLNVTAITAAEVSRIGSEPVIYQNPNPRVPLAAIIKFKTTGQVKTKIKVSDGERQWELNFDFDQWPAHGLPIVGMRAGRKHSFVITIQDAKGNSVKFKDQLSYTTPPLPPFGKEFPTIDLKISQPALMEPGVTLLSVRRSSIGRDVWALKKQFAFSKDWGLLLALDAQGEVIWYYIAEKRIAGVDRLRNGNIYFQLSDSRTVEIDILGNTVNQWYAKNRPEGELDGGTVVDTQTLHHQPHEMPSGNFLSLAAIARKIDNYYTSEYDEKAPRKTQDVMGDSILEFDRSGKILWRWDSFEHLDINRIGYNLTQPYWHVRGFKNHLDWSHANGISYNESDNSILLSLRNQDALIKIDKATSEIKWIISPHSGWNKTLSKKLLTPVGADFRWPYHAHNPRLTSAGTIAVFDNGPFQSRPFNVKSWEENMFSRGVEFKVDEENMTVRQVWTSHDKRDENSCMAYIMGEVHRLPMTDNMLVVFPLCPPLNKGISFNEWTSPRHFKEYPYGARVQEYARGKKKEVVYDVRIKDADDMMSWSIYGGLRFNSLYSTLEERQFQRKP